MMYLSHKKRVVYVKNSGFFQQDNVNIHNAIKTKTYFLEQKKSFLDLPVRSSNLNPLENLRRLIGAKVYEGCLQYSAISELKITILNTWENTFSSSSETG